MFNIKTIKMAITFYVQSKKNPAIIYVRVREGKKIDAKAKTKLKVNPLLFEKGKVIVSKIPPRVTADTKKEIKEQNSHLINLQNDINSLNAKITNLLNVRKDYETINSDWLKNVVNPDTQIKEIPNTLVGYFDYFLDFKKTSLKPSTLKKLKVFKHRIVNYEKTNGVVYIQEVNKKFCLSMQKWCDDNNYAHNTKVKTIKVIVTVCNHAIDNGIVTSPELQVLTRNLKYKNLDNIILSFEEIKQISETKILEGSLNDAKDWLLISCHTGQRVSDFLKFKKSNIIKKGGLNLLDIRQEKTENPIFIPIVDEVLDILNRRGDFPPIFSKNKDSNSAIYNLLIKKVCKLAGINKIVTANRKNPKTNRYEIKEEPKYKAVTSHIGRRSFATNYYGEIDTPLLMSVTGHKTETQFLRYVGKTQIQNSIILAKKMNELKYRQKIEALNTSSTSELTNDLRAV